MSRYKLGIALVLLVCGAAVGWAMPRRGSQDGERLFGWVSGLVASRFVDSLDQSDIYEKAARGLLGQLHDPYANLFPRPRSPKTSTWPTKASTPGSGCCWKRETRAPW